MYRVLIGSPGLAEAAELARQAALAAGAGGRPLAAANADLPWPQEPHLVLWHAVNILREHRGDGHIAALLAAGLDPCEALVSFAAIGAAPEEVFASRCWVPRSNPACSQPQSTPGIATVPTPRQRPSRSADN